MTSGSILSKLGRIKDCCQVGDGAHTCIKRQSHGVMYLTSKNFKSTGLDLSKVDYIQEQDFERHFKSSKNALVKPKSGDVVFGIIGSLGIPYVVKEEDRFGISSSVAILRPQENLHSKYLYYYMTSSAFQCAVNAIKSGVAQGFLSLEMIRSLPIVLCDKQSQKKIVSILSAYDELIDNNNQRIALLEQMAEEIYKEWFVRLRFPGHQQTQIVDDLPEGWKIVRIDDAFEIIGGGTPSTAEKSYWENGTVNWVTPSDITASAGLFITDTPKKITEAGLAGSSAKLFSPYSVMMTSRATIGEIGINMQPASTNQGFITCLPNEIFPYTYIAGWLNLHKTLIDNYASGATFKEISKSVFKRLKVIKPTLSVIQKYHQQADPLYRAMNNLLEKNKTLKQTRDLLLPRLISGKLSVEHLLGTDN